MLTLNDGRSELWQWDTGRTVSVDADCSQVHFSNKVFGRSIDVDVLDGVAIIPDVLLQTDKELSVWAFVGTAENGYTKISKVFKVNRRNKPSDYVFTPPEQTTLGEILERLDDLESVKVPDAVKNAVEDYLEQNPVEAPVQSVNGKTGTVELTSEDVGAISQDDLQEATNEALAKAKESGEFDGEPGRDYVLTDEDKAEIAELAAELVEIPDSGGNVAYDEEQELTEEQKAQARANIGAQPVGEYLTEVPEGYAKNEDIKKVDRKVDTLREVVSKFHSNIVCDSKGEVITVSDASDMELAGLRIFGKTTQDGTPTPDAPVELVSVGDGGSIVTTVAGKNLAAVSGSYTSKGITHTVDATGQITSVGTLEDGYNYTDICTYIYQNLNTGGTFTLSVNKVLPYNLGIKIKYIDNTLGDIMLYAGSRSKKFTISKEVMMYYFFFANMPVGSDVNLTYTLQLEFGGDATDYDPFITPQTMTISTPNGLPGIPVTSGGNYTDPVTQKQWICDEVDFEKGVYVQRIRKVIAKNLTKGYLGPKVFNAEFTTGFPAKPAKTNSEKADIMCDSLPVKSGDDQYNYGASSVALGNTGVGYISFEGMTTLAQVNARLAEKDITIMYILAEENPISLTAGQLAAFAALHSNYPNTTIFNDGGAGMEVKYVADTKLYIDKKFAELSAALLNQ